MPNSGHIIGILHGNACVMDDYNAKLELMNDELNKAQIINNSIVEGASDYVYQLDVVNDTCTFSLIWVNSHNLGSFPVNCNCIIP